ncbi:hypothetical protein MASR2M39_08700 [Ignavibacteriales bacterium]
MKLFFSLSITAFVFIIIFTGCKNESAKPVKVTDSTTAVQSGDSSLADEFKRLFYKQIQALKAKKSGDYLSTLSINSFDSVQAAKHFETITQMYDLDYNIVKFSLLRHDLRTAEVEVEMKVEKINGPPFEDHLSVTRHILENKEGKWLILESREINYTVLRPKQ